MKSLLKRAVLNVVGPRLLLSARIAEVHEASENFRFIDIESEAFKSMVLRPGEKVQINTGAWCLRTYTPLSLDAEEGRLGILAYVHGQGPGSRWAAQARAGDPCQLLGPRPSLRLPEPALDAHRSLLHGRMGELLETLSYREREVLKLRYGLGDGYCYTLAEAAQIFRVSRERIRQIETRAFGKLQQLAGQELAGFLD